MHTSYKQNAFSSSLTVFETMKHRRFICTCIFCDFQLQLWKMFFRTQSQLKFWKIYEARYTNIARRCLGDYMQIVFSGEQSWQYAASTHFSPITGRALKAWTLLLRSNVGIVCLNPTQGIDVSVYPVFVLPRACSGLSSGWSPVQGVLPTV
jgi:hypothetical protein